MTALLLALTIAAGAPAGGGYGYEPLQQIGDESVDVVEGDRVEPECRLGTSGSTGRSFGAHLHFEVRFDGTAVDPLVFLEGLDRTSALAR